jgi:hypothetical protein
MVDFSDGVHHGSMVLTAKVVPNLHERSIGQLFGQVHRQLPWQDHYSRCGSLVEFLHVHAEFAGNVLLDSLDLACRNFHRVERLHPAFFLGEVNLSVCCGSETLEGVTVVAASPHRLTTSQP